MLAIDADTDTDLFRIRSAADDVLAAERRRQMGRWVGGWMYAISRFAVSLNMNEIIGQQTNKQTDEPTESCKFVIG